MWEKSYFQNDFNKNMQLNPEGELECSSSSTTFEQLELLKVGPVISG